MAAKRGNSAISKVVKRDGSIVPFDREKIVSAIFKAAVAVGKREATANEIARDTAKKVVNSLSRRFQKKPPRVEDIQDFVERALIEGNHSEIAKAYILYRKKREELREAKQFLGVKDELKLSINAAKVLQARYLLKDESGNPIETPSQLFRRVAKAIAAVDRKYDKKADAAKTEEEFYSLMTHFDFIPNTPTLMNAGTKLGQLSACFVIPVGDSLIEIFDAVKYMALIHQSGGGTGFSFSRLRPRGDFVRSTHGVASGPVSFMKIFDATTDVIKQGGKRRGANMGILRVDHPDIIEFITSKIDERQLRNFNISVAATDKFMKAVEMNQEYELINPRTNEVVKKLKARDVFDLMVTSAWKTGDPGMVFIDAINRHNQTPKLGAIESTNPCGEQPLQPFDSCNLGSINMANFVDGKDVNWVKLKRTIRSCVHFLDNVIDANTYPIPQIDKMTKKNRKIGLGIMGFAEMLIKLGIPYNSEEALQLADRLMKFFSQEAHRADIELAEKRGSFPAFAGSAWEKKGFRKFRNSTVTTIAPTGTISIIANCTSGIEPLFAVAFVRNVLEGTRLLEVNKEFEQIARERGFYSAELMSKISETGSLQDVEGVPDDLKKIFVTALDIEPEWHVRMQAVFQKHTDNAVSKTINLKHEATVDDVRKAYLLAYKLNCKGITIFRYGSKKEQVLYTGPMLTKELATEEKHVRAEPEFSGGCPVYCQF